jgi:methylmalonyl-CoA/ethylmalonyl-CoA epimerase
MISRLDHVAIAVKDYTKAMRFFQGVLGAVSGATSEDQAMKYYWENLYLGDLSRLEILTSTGKGSFLDNFLKDKQGGVHHITFQTPDIYETRNVLEKHQIPFFGFNDFCPVWKELYIHHRDAFGVLIQIAEFQPDDWIAESARLPDNRKWGIEKNGEDIKIKFAHPGGGAVGISLSVDDAANLIHELSAVLEKAHA